MSNIEKYVGDTKKDDVSGMLVAIKNRVAQILPKMIGPDRVMQSMAHCIRLNPQLMNCTRDSLLAGLLQSAREGMEIGTECHLIPRSNKGRLQCVYQRDFRGELTLARRSGEYASINVGVHYQNDEVIEMYTGAESAFKIRETMGDRGEIAFFWCASKLKSGEVSYTRLSPSEAREHMEKYAPKNRQGQVVGPWIDHFEAMALKTVVKKHLKYGPKAFEQHSVLADERVLSLDSGFGDMPAPLPEPEQPKQLEDVPEGVDPETGEVKKKKKTGRPKGSKNKPKPQPAPAPAQEEPPTPEEPKTYLKEDMPEETPPEDGGPTEEELKKGYKEPAQEAEVLEEVEQPEEQPERPALKIPVIKSLHEANQSVVDDHIGRLKNYTSGTGLRRWIKTYGPADLTPQIGEKATLGLHEFAYTCLAKLEDEKEWHQK